MSQKIFLTSALAMGVIAPAFAEPSHTGEFPSDGYMQEDYTYTNAATADNMDSVYEGTVNAVAEYDIIDYIVNAGQYLPADSETVITCPAGSYCPGIDGNVQYNQTTPQGIQTCPTGYASSAAGASSDTECYRQCSGNVTIEHATGVTGNDYYGNGVDTCEPTDCVNGWHLKRFNLADTIGDIQAVNSAWITADTGVFRENAWTGGPTNNPKGQSYYGMYDNNSWAVYYGDEIGAIIGKGLCSTQSGYQDTVNNQNNNYWNNPTIFDTLVEEAGQNDAKHCYCKITGYKDSNGILYNIESSWVYGYFFDLATGFQGMADTCDYSCSQYCMSGLILSTKDSSFREAKLSAIKPTLASCEANTITINWSDAAQTDIDANNAGTATYGSDVRTPVKAATKKGQTFKGWRFSKPTETNLP